MINAEFPGQVKLRIEDKWLSDFSTTQAYADCRNLDSTNRGRQQRPRGILISSNSADANATTATVQGVLWDENHKQAATYTLALGIVHPLAFKFVYAAHTNGRGIFIIG